MSTAVAITGIITGRAVELAAILTGGWLLHAMVPQLRMQAPAKDAKADTAVAVPPAGAGDTTLKEAA